MYIALIGGWCFVAAVVSAGPLALQTIEKGPYCTSYRKLYGIRGRWTRLMFYYSRFVGVLVLDL